LPEERFALGPAGLQFFIEKLQAHAAHKQLLIYICQYQHTGRDPGLLAAPITNFSFS
jgi:hypothetical protein